MPLVSASSAVIPSGPTLPATQTSFPCAARRARRAAAGIYLQCLIAETKPIKAHPAGAERVGFNNPRTGRDVGLMNLEHPLRLTQAKLLETSLQGNALVEQHRAHCAVAADDTILEFVEEIHCLMRLTSRRPRVKQLQRRAACPLSGAPFNVRSRLARENDLFFIPAMLLATVDTGHGPGLHLGPSKGIFFNYHPGNIEFFCYRTSHQDSLDHAANISHQRAKSLPNLGASQPLMIFECERTLRIEANNSQQVPITFHCRSILVLSFRALPVYQQASRATS